MSLRFLRAAPRRSSSSDPISGASCSRPIPCWRRRPVSARKRAEPRAQPAPAKPRRRVLFFGEAVTLAHIGRPLALARGLDSSRYEAIVACDPRFRSLHGDGGLAFRKIRSIPSERFLQVLSSGSPVYDLTTLRDYVAEDLDVIQSVDPDVVVGDFRLSLAVSARLANVPYMTITNACWSPYADRAIPLGDHPAKKLLGLATAQSIFKALRPLALAYHSLPMNRLRREFGFESVGYDLRQVFTEADYTLYADVPQLSLYFGPAGQPPLSRSDSLVAGRGDAGLVERPGRGTADDLRDPGKLGDLICSPGSSGPWRSFR